MISELEHRQIDALQSFKILQDVAARDGDIVQIDPYVYAGRLTIPAGGKRNVSIPIENDSDFYLTQMGAAAVDQTGAQAGNNELVYVQVTDAATNRHFFQSPILYWLAFGTHNDEGFAAFNPAPRIFAANSRINIEANFPVAIAATSVTLQLAFIGARVAFARGH